MKAKIGSPAAMAFSPRDGYDDDDDDLDAMLDCIEELQKENAGLMALCDKLYDEIADLQARLK